MGELSRNQLAAFQEQGMVTSFKSWREVIKDEYLCALLYLATEGLLVTLKE